MIHNTSSHQPPFDSDTFVVFYSPSVFQSFLLATWCLSALTDFLLARAFRSLFDYEVEELPAGL